MSQTPQIAEGSSLNGFIDRFTGLVNTGLDYYGQYEKIQADKDLADAQARYLAEHGANPMAMNSGSGDNKAVQDEADDKMKTQNATGTTFSLQTAGLGAIGLIGLAAVGAFLILK